MNMLVCPHCADPTESNAAFCASCGLAVATTFPGGPSLLEGDELAKTPVGRRLQHASLGQYCRSVANTLITLGVLQMFACGILSWVSRDSANQDALMPLVYTLGILGVVFLALGSWAYKSPLPAGIIGLVLYSTLSVLHWIQQISMMGQTAARDSNVEVRSFRMDFIIQIIIIGFLVKGVKSALTRRRLQQQMNNGN
jgi:hypothetical protein